jgi:hypothetical protein
MCKNCVLPAQSLRENSCISSGFYTTRFVKNYSLRINQGYTSSFQHRVHIVVHIKYSLITSVNRRLSTVSTVLTMKPVFLNLNKLLIIGSVS